MKKLTVLWVVAMATLAGLATTASADQKLYSGTECVAYGTDQSRIEYNLGRAYNSLTSGMIVYCPVVMDVHALNSSSTWIYLWDRNYNEDFDCYLRTQSASSTSYYYSAVSTIGTSEQPTKHGFSSTSYYTDGMRYIYCFVPGVYSGNKSGIMAYSVNEG